MYGNIRIRIRQSQCICHLISFRYHKGARHLIHAFSSDIYFTHIPGGFQDHIRILSTVFKLFGCTHRQPDSFFQCFLNLCQTASHRNRICSASAQKFLIFRIIRADIRFRFSYDSQLALLIIVNLQYSILLIQKTQGSGLFLSIFHQKRIGISHHHTLVGKIQSVFIAEGKSFLRQIHPLSRILFQINFHGICICALQPWKNINPRCRQPVISIDIRTARTLHGYGSLHLWNLHFPDFISFR